jgi:hypothetical protein
VRPISISSDFFESSVHALLNCRECHSDIAAIPHPDAQRTVSCGQACHQRNAEGSLYSHETLFWEHSQSVHGTAETGAVGCTVCHPASSLTELVRRDLQHEAEECASCHFDNSHVEAYFSDIHYLALDAGSRRAPSCPDCHTSHQVRSADDEESATHRDRLADTCGGGAVSGPPGRCHEGVLKESLTAASMKGLALPARRPGVLDWVFTVTYWLLLLGLTARAGAGMFKGR